MPAKGTKPVTKQLFDTVTSQLKAGNPTLGVAHVNGISPSTVKSIRQAGTWTEFGRRKAAKVAKNTAARNARSPKKPTKVTVKVERAAAKPVKVRTPKAATAPKTITIDEVEFQHVATKSDLKAMESHLQKHLDGIADILTTHVRDEAIHRAKAAELLRPELHISRRLDNMDQSLIRIERVLQPVRRWFGVRRRG